MRRLVATSVALASAFASGPALSRERAEVPEKYRWNLADLYPSEAAWSEARSAASREALNCSRSETRRAIEP